MRILLPVFCLFLAAAPALAGVDARTQEGSQRKSFCFAYSFMDNWNDWKSGQIDKEHYDRQRIQIIWKILDKGDNNNYALDERKLKRAFRAIEASQPSPADISETADYCHAFLRL